MFQGRVNQIKNEHHGAQAAGIIGGADGPTSVIITGSKSKKPLRFRIKKFFYNCRYRRAEKKIVAGTHTLDELAAYAVSRYGAAEVDKTHCDCPAHLRFYEVKSGEDCLDIEIDRARDSFGVSFSGNKKAMKHFRKIAKDLYLYYGVSEDDINNRTRRYLSLLGILSI